mgnify:CR=1 FL=1
MNDRVISDLERLEQDLLECGGTSEQDEHPMPPRMYQPMVQPINYLGGPELAQWDD